MKSQERIGILVNDLLSPYQIRLLNSMKRAANSRRARVIGFQGSFLAQQEQEKQAPFDGSFIYGLAGEESVDGLIIVSGVLSSRVGIDAVRNLCRKSKLPAVSIGHLPDVPSVVIGCKDALTTVVNHLVLHHARRKIVIIEGPPGNPDSIERCRIVKETLARLDVPLMDSHVVAGDFLESSGNQAMRLLMDQRGVPPSEFDAIISLNDQMAVGAINELSSRGIHVPRDVCVVGFDDDDFARSAHPPLTTIAQPIALIGERAIQMVMSRIRRNHTENLVVIEAEPVWRRSCGCDAPRVRHSIGNRPDEAGAVDIAAIASISKKWCNAPPRRSSTPDWRSFDDWAARPSIGTTKRACTSCG